jgi:type IV pilus assembly protein PilA
MIDIKPHRQFQPSRQTGFTLIELMITVAIIGILASMAIVSYQDYVTRTKISDGLALAGAAKLAVSEYYSTESLLPESNTAAGLPLPTSITSNYTSSVSIGVTPISGTITITYSGIGTLADGKTLLLVPMPSITTIKWECTSTTLSNTLRPSSCRD